MNISWILGFQANEKERTKKNQRNKDGWMDERIKGKEEGNIRVGILKSQCPMSSSASTAYVSTGSRKNYKSDVNYCSLCVEYNNPVKPIDH